MLCDKQVERMLAKLKRFEDILDPLLFEKVDTLPMKYYATHDNLNAMPDVSLMMDCESGTLWSKSEGTYGWFLGEYKVPEVYAGKNLFVRPSIEGTEAMLFVNGVPNGTFNTKITVTAHGNHYCDMIKKNVVAGEVIKVGFEYYAGHFVRGCFPLEESGRTDYNHAYKEVAICIKNEEINDFYFDLKTLNQLVHKLDATSFRRADVINTLMEAHKTLLYALEDTTFEEFMSRIRKVAPLFKQQLAKHNSVSAPQATLIGHSHMDTAWLWHRDETVKKCARTYSNELNLMDQYPEYTFIQSSAYHSKVIKENYPELFARMKERIKEGRYEPNGGVFVECDCNIPTGEFMVRQFLWGQNFTRKEFDFTSNSFWLPDTFGYSPALPQIMKGCGVNYFLTTKMAWSDTNQFPYDTFYWQGIDGTRVLTHLNKTHIWPDVESLMDYVVNGLECIKEKTVTNKKLLSYGFGDGGGGPQFEMIEMARRVVDLEGVPKAQHGTVGKFMDELSDSLVNPSVYADELYLELHRGTLTNQHTIKRNNRKAEIAIHDLEYMTVREGVEKDTVITADGTSELVESLLINQFHDILPGTCIPRAHDEAIAEVGSVIKKARERFDQLVTGKESDKVTVINTLAMERCDTVYLTLPEGKGLQGDFKQQVVCDLDGNQKVAVGDVRLKSLESRVFELCDFKTTHTTRFAFEGNTLKTPYYTVTFDENMKMTSLIDHRVNRELRGEGYPLNTFLIAEDLPSQWDNWDIDADLELKYEDCSHLVNCEVIADGEILFTLRCQYQITEKSSITQDMTFFADSPEIRFETKMNWNDNHRFLKTAFDTTVFSDFVRNEIQFGYIKRPTTRSTTYQKAKFEISNHKYTDLSEARYGVCLLNDCKYGISCEDSKLRLSLHKGGTRPDDRGDHGIHECTYSFYPHTGGFGADTVVAPAYCLNYPVHTVSGDATGESFLSVSENNIIVETIKPCEETGKSFILRLYEAEGATTRTVLHMGRDVKGACITNMLEETMQELVGQNDFHLSFRPFEIKTVKITF